MSKSKILMHNCRLSLCLKPEHGISVGEGFKSKRAVEFNNAEQRGGSLKFEHNMVVGEGSIQSTSFDSRSAFKLLVRVRF